MLFYTIIVSMEEAEEPVRSRETPEDKELAGKLLACSEANYQQNGQYYYFFATGIKRTRIQFGAVLSLRPMSCLLFQFICRRPAWQRSISPYRKLPSPHSELC